MNEMSLFSQPHSMFPNVKHPQSELPLASDGSTAASVRPRPQLFASTDAIKPVVLLMAFYVEPVATPKLATHRGIGLGT